MRPNVIVMSVLAIVFGASAVLVANRWLVSKNPRVQVQAAAEKPAPVPMGTIVVAAGPLRYGAEVGPRQTREIPWPSGALPAGAFKTSAEFLGGGKRVALAAMEENEPILASKVTGPGQRGTLSMLVDEGMSAVTVQVNEVVGVAGFVVPGDRVDVVLTRQNRGGEAVPAATQPSAFADIVLQNVRVLAVGQVADQKTEKPAVVNAVTLEVDQLGGQKVALAAASGSLTLMLRKAGDVETREGRRVSANELGQQTAPAVSSTLTVRVTRGMKRDEYSVPSTRPLQPRVMDQVASAQAAERD